ncbi:MAG: hypothetical protein DWH73_00640 [Planctomycetota bacterium]|nr:MAG: hypothetical protein DWH73_00640 [Planctomycetota bacterium]
MGVNPFTAVVVNSKVAMSVSCINLKIRQAAFLKVGSFLDFKREETKTAAPVCESGLVWPMISSPT